jgi:hypothetical protein
VRPPRLARCARAHLRHRRLSSRCCTHFSRSDALCSLSRSRLRPRPRFHVVGRRVATLQAAERPARACLHSNALALCSLRKGAWLAPRSGLARAGVLALAVDAAMCAVCRRMAIILVHLRRPPHGSYSPLRCVCHPSFSFVFLTCSLISFCSPIRTPVNTFCCRPPMRNPNIRAIPIKRQRARVTMVTTGRRWDSCGMRERELAAVRSYPCRDRKRLGQPLRRIRTAPSSEHTTAGCRLERTTQHTPGRRGSTHVRMGAQNAVRRDRGEWQA